MTYNEAIMDHFSKPRNVGEIENPDGVGEVGNPVCGDMMKFTIKVIDNRLDDVKFLTFGCGAAIAVSSMVSEMAKGKTLDEAMQITNKDVAKALGGLPGNKMHCSNLGADALHKAIEDYRDRHNQEGKPLQDETKDPETDKTEEQCGCPYCDDFDCPITSDYTSESRPDEHQHCPECKRPLGEQTTADTTTQ